MAHDRGRGVPREASARLIMLLRSFYPDASEQSMIVDPRNREDVFFFSLSLSLPLESQRNGRHFAGNKLISPLRRWKHRRLDHRSQRLPLVCSRHKSEIPRVPRPSFPSLLPHPPFRRGSFRRGRAKSYFLCDNRIRNLSNF